MRQDHGTEEASKHGVTRSPHWPMAEHHYLRVNPACAASGITVGVQVHHVIPFHFCILLGRPDLELDPRNFIGLSESEKGTREVNYHLLIGHANCFRSSNIPVRDDAKTYYGFTTEAITAAPAWLDREKTRLKPWDEMTDDDKKSLRILMDEWYPLPDGVTPEAQLQILVGTCKQEVP